MFADALAPLGEWLLTTGGERVWRPAGVADAWRPYASGSWSWTAEGWYWVSDEPWAWATYHYGRWRVDAQLGWTWIPGDEWAPAWVVWRYAPDAVGWAPRADGASVLPAHWTFVPASRFGGIEVPRDAVPAARTPLLFARSRPGDGELARGPRPLGAERAVALPSRAAVPGAASAPRARHARR